jgi:hypothetical protein
MQEHIRVKRLWSMGQFSNVELETTLSDIPEKVSLNPRAVGLLYNLMTLQLEAAHKEYLQLYKNHPVLIKVFPEIIDYLDEALLAIREEKTQTFDELMKELRTDGN